MNTFFSLDNQKKNQNTNRVIIYNNILLIKLNNVFTCRKYNVQQINLRQTKIL